MLKKNGSSSLVVSSHKFGVTRNPQRETTWLSVFDNLRK